MKRLIKKSAQDNTVVDVSPQFVPMGELDEADVKNNRCPACKIKAPLERIDGFKKCLNCNATFKTFDGNSYTVAKQ